MLAESLSCEIMEVEVDVIRCNQHPTLPTGGLARAGQHRRASARRLEFAQLLSSLSYFLAARVEGFMEGKVCGQPRAL